MTAPPSVVVIGSGFGGVAAAVRLLGDGVRELTIVERYGDTGGTWRDNTYPGAACDIPSHLYSLSFAPKSDWSRSYAPQPEIRAYLDEVVADHGLRDRTLFGFDVRAATWDEDTTSWTLTSADGRTVTADVVVNAIGGLKDPSYPAIDGLEDFAGPVVHSARWDHDVPFAGARVAVVGTGASAIQFVPELVEEVGHLTLFQRTAPWVVPRGDRAFTTFEQLAFRHVPGARLLKRAALYVEHEATRSAFSEGTPLHTAARLLSTAHLRRQVRDPQLRAAVTPDYSFGCKRVLRSNDYYPALTRDHVEVVTDGIARIEPDAVVTTDGRRVEVDAIVLGTGFTVDDPLHGMVVTGRDGRDLDAFWDGRPSAHLGITVPGFPNLYTLLGPNAALGHNSVVLMIEAAVEHIRDAVRRMQRRDVAAIAVTQDAHDRFVAWIDDEIEGTSWSGGCASWYLNTDGRNFTLWPGSVTSYRRATRRLDPADHESTPARTPAAPVVATPGPDTAPPPTARPRATEQQEQPA